MEMQHPSSTICGHKVLFPNQSFLSIWIRTYSITFPSRRIRHYSWLSRDTEAPYSGDLIFGDIDGSRYTGSITYTPVVIQGYWEIQMDK